MPNSALHASALLAQLQALIDQHGDLLVYIADADTGWPLVPTLKLWEKSQWGDATWNKIAPCIVLAATYEDDPMEESQEEV